MTSLEWSRFCLECYQKVFDLISSKKPQDIIGGILSMDQLVGMQIEENELIFQIHIFTKDHKTSNWKLWWCHSYISNIANFTLWSFNVISIKS